MQHDYSYITQYTEKNLLLDLTPYMKSKKLNVSKVPVNFISGGQVNGKYYGISAGTNAWAVIYDPVVLRKAGVAAPKPSWTWAKFEKIALAVYKKTGVRTMPGWSYFAYLPLAAFFQTSYSVLQNFLCCDSIQAGFQT
jgi:multiple sugar transport system substrate-binding protein